MWLTLVLPLLVVDLQSLRVGMVGLLLLLALMFSLRTRKLLVDEWVHLRMLLQLLNALLALLLVAQLGDAVRVVAVEDAEGSLGDAVAVGLLCLWRAVRAVV